MARGVPRRAHRSLERLSMGAVGAGCDAEIHALHVYGRRSTSTRRCIAGVSIPPADRSRLVWLVPVIVEGREALVGFERTLVLFAAVAPQVLVRLEQQLLSLIELLELGQTRWRRAGGDGRQPVIGHERRAVRISIASRNNGRASSARLVCVRTAPRPVRPLAIDACATAGPVVGWPAACRNGVSPPARSPGS